MAYEDLPPPRVPEGRTGFRRHPVLWSVALLLAIAVVAALAFGASDAVTALGCVPAGNAVGPLALAFFEQRLAGVPAGTTCGTTLPVTPAG
jgi:hypothetical protein